MAAPETPLPANRRAQLAQVVRERGQATVTELAAAFDVSHDTVRRDLDYLASQGVLARTHGGAVTTNGLTTADMPFARRAATASGAKRRIGQAAREFASDHATLLFNGGTTTIQVAASLGGFRDLTLVTNNLRLPAVVPQEALREVYIIGGLYRAESQVTIGAVGFPGMKGIGVDTAFIGVGGISESGGLSTTNVAEARMMYEMIEAARRVVVVCDSRKFGRNAFVHIAGLEAVSALVTDEAPPGPLRDALAAAGVHVVVAS